LFLHGAEESGSDNEAQLVRYKAALVFADKKNQNRNPCYVIAPKLPLEYMVDMLNGKGGWTDSKYQQTLGDLVRGFGENPNIDRTRIYITGLSMGAMGTWALIESNPDLFAAAMPVCGMGDVAKVSKIKHMQIWAFHAENDPIVPVAGSDGMSTPPGIFKFTDNAKGTRDVVDALKSVGNTKVKYTEYKVDDAKMQGLPIAHFSWVSAYNNQEAINWLFENRNNK